jgi:hypothetical protein
MKTVSTLNMFFFAVLCLATGAYAQRGFAGGPADGNAPPPPQGMVSTPLPLPTAATLMHAGNSGLFILAGMQLTKYEAATLQEIASISLNSALAVPPDPWNLPARLNFPARPQAPAAFLIADVGHRETILAVVGDTFYLIDARKMTITTQHALPPVAVSPRQHGSGPGPRGGNPPNRNANGNNRPRRNQGGASTAELPAQVSLELHEHTLYVLRANQLLALNSKSGEVLAQGTTAGKPGTDPRE